MPKKECAEASLEINHGQYYCEQCEINELTDEIDNLKIVVAVERETSKRIVNYTSTEIQDNRDDKDD